MSLKNKKLNYLKIKRTRRDRKLKYFAVLGEAPMRIAIVQKIQTLTPRKPNSAQRRVLKGSITSASSDEWIHIPKVGHNLTFHKRVMISPPGPRDLPQCNLRAKRGWFDLIAPKLYVSNRKGDNTHLKSRSLYGISRIEKKKIKFKFNINYTFPIKTQRYFKKISIN